jgi:hypothetical protein
MKKKEINLSSASLDKEQDFETRILEEKEEIKEKKEVGEKGKKISIKEKIKGKIDKFKAWWQAAPKRTKILTIAIPALIILGTSSFFFYYTIFGPRSRTPELISIDTNYIAPRTEKTLEDGFRFLALSSPSLPRTEESPINGRLFTREEMDELKEKRPIAAMINNHIQARPTSNLIKADLVYEVLVESGITRFLAIYWGNDPNKVGSMRSARQYYLEWLSPFDPLFVYDGFASSNNPKVDAKGNIGKYAIKSIYTAGAWRVTDRVAPHNEYFSTVKTWEIAQERGWEGFPEIESWKFKNDAPLENRNDRFRGKISFSHSEDYNVVWDYEKTTNRYYRNIGGIPDTDLETGQQITAKNIVIQEVAIQGPVDEYSRLIITTIGSGPAAILQDGKVIYGEWEKADRTSRTRYYDNNSQEIEFNRGLTWISAVRQLGANFDIIEQ